jgi:hypothetical protein
MMPQHLLSSYLNDHLAAANASVALFERTRNGLAGTPWNPELALLTDEVVAGRSALREVMDVLGVHESRTKQLAALAAERLGRLKPNGHLRRRTVLTDLVELEALRVSMAVRINGLQVLRALAVQDARLRRDTFELLLDGAQDQADRLYRLHLQCARELTVAA